MEPNELFRRLNDRDEPLHERVGLLYVLARDIANGRAIPFGLEMSTESVDFFADTGDGELCSAVNAALANDDRSGLVGLGYTLA